MSTTPPAIAYSASNRVNFSTQRRARAAGDFFNSIVFGIDTAGSLSPIAHQSKKLQPITTSKGADLIRNRSKGLGLLGPVKQG